MRRKFASKFFMFLHFLSIHFLIYFLEEHNRQVVVLVVALLQLLTHFLDNKYALLQSQQLPLLAVQSHTGYFQANILLPNQIHYLINLLILFLSIFLKTLLVSSSCTPYPPDLKWTGCEYWGPYPAGKY